MKCSLLSKVKLERCGLIYYQRQKKWGLVWLKEEDLTKKGRNERRRNIPNTCDLNFPTLKTKTNENKKSWQNSRISLSNNVPSMFIRINTTTSAEASEGHGTFHQLKALFWRQLTPFDGKSVSQTALSSQTKQALFYIFKTSIANI